MRATTTLLALLILAPHPTVAQAPAWADLWRVAEGALVRPAALGDGPTAVFWNPAATVSQRRASFAVDVYQTPDVVNVSAVLLGATLALGRQVGVGLVAGRASVGDLVRTSTSPIGEGADIPVYAQFAGAAIGGRVGPLEGGVTTLLHDTRLDARDAGGITVDLGVRVRPFTGLVIGVATHLGEPIATGGAASEYLGGAEYAAGIPPVFGLAAELHVRYGFTAREAGSADHLGSAGLLLADRLLIEAGALRAGGYGAGAWQPLLGIAFKAGPFRVGIARGAGASDIGATYRITFGVTGTP
ncbi:MAG: hypothetical protein OEY20_01270 [Gemmatimonadota bacterium]|nr:hypothetical protein [Gemmatimonadota bacterium]MDH4351466.1 hypothetical protein [Gemmatimonadota bacterium]MDH5195863.1 hypothetical protein [Gemmatimonadota bacterium]